MKLRNVALETKIFLKRSFLFYFISVNVNFISSNKNVFYDFNFNIIVNNNNPGATLTKIYNTLLNRYKTSNKG